MEHLLVFSSLNFRALNFKVALPSAVLLLQILLALGGEGGKYRSIPRSGDGNGGGIGGCGGGVVEVRWAGRRVVHFPRQLHGELVAVGLHKVVVFKASGWGRSPVLLVCDLTLFVGIRLHDLRIIFNSGGAQFRGRRVVRSQDSVGGLGSAVGAAVGRRDRGRPVVVQYSIIVVVGVGRAILRGPRSLRRLDRILAIFQALVLLALLPLFILHPLLQHRGLPPLLVCDPPQVEVLQSLDVLDNVGPVEV
mmetsp:Transcript_2476/g.4481  ORF Transcript_2476/g.4481 Transcript_2476/m.4481 type:complete len:249 (+) Transcript_2476:812-1558(+)